MDHIDIYGYDKIMAEVKARIERTPMPPGNRELLLGFDRLCVLEGLSIGRRIKLLIHILRFAKDFPTLSFASATKQDLQEAIARVETRQDIVNHTKHDIKITIRKFFSWVVLRDAVMTTENWPELVAWIKPTLKKRDRCRVKASDLLSADDVERLIAVTRNPRNRAFIAMLYEIGGRVGELGNLRVGDITRDEYSLLVDVDGKTGKRTVRLVLYASHVVGWMNLHPARDDPSAALWPSLRPKTYLRPLPYREFTSWIQTAKEAAGIKKRLYPHLFRHSRATHLLASGKLNEAQAKVYFGWVPDSGILATYAHLATHDANDALLRMYGIAKEQQTESQGANCGMCSAANPKTAAFCYRCGYALTMAAANGAKDRVRGSEETILRFLQAPEAREVFKKWYAEQTNTSSTSTVPLEQAPPTPAPTAEDRWRRHRAA